MLIVVSAVALFGALACLAYVFTSSSSWAAEKAAAGTFRVLEACAGAPSLTGAPALDLGPYCRSPRVRPQNADARSASRSPSSMHERGNSS